MTKKFNKKFINKLLLPIFTIVSISVFSSSLPFTLNGNFDASNNGSKLTYINNAINNIEPKTDKSTGTIAKIYLGCDDQSMHYTHDEYVLDDAQMLASAGNGEIYRNDNHLTWSWSYNNTPSAKRDLYSLALYKGSDGLFRLDKGDGQAANSGSAPNWAVSFTYVKLDNRSFIKDSDIVHKYANKYTTTSDGVKWTGTSENGVLFNNEPFGGFVQFMIPYYRYDYTNKPNGANTRFAQFGLANSTNSYSWTALNTQSTSFDSVKSYSNWYFGKPYDYSSNGWSRQSLALGVFDDKLWFTNAQSTIEEITFDTAKVSIEEFVDNMNDSQWINQYLSITLRNTPKGIVQNNDTLDSYVDINVDETAKTVTFALTIPKTYTPDFTLNHENEITNETAMKWVSNTAMTKTITYNFNEFRIDDTVIKPTIVSNGISAASTNLANLSPLELWNRESDIQHFIYSKKEELFDNLPTLEWKNMQASEVISTVGSSDYRVISQTSTSLKFSFGAKYVYFNKQLIEEYRPFVIEITDLDNKDTKVKEDIATNGIQASSDLAKFSPYEIAQVIEQDQSNNLYAHNELKKFLQLEYKNIFDYYYDFTNDNDFISFTNDKGLVDTITTDSITFYFTVKTVYANGVIVSTTSTGDWDPSIYRRFKITITGLQEKENTIIKNSIEQNGYTIPNSIGLKYSVLEVKEIIGVDKTTYSPKQLQMYNDIISHLETNIKYIFDYLVELESYDNTISFESSFGEFVSIKGGSITLKLTVNPYINNYQVISDLQNCAKNFTLTINGFQTKETRPLEVIDIDVSSNSTYNNSFASQLNETSINEIVTNEIINNPNKYFEDLPTLTQQQDYIIIESYSTNDNTGIISIFFYLPKYYYNGEIIDYQESLTSNILFNATIRGFLTLSSNIFDKQYLIVASSSSQINPTFENPDSYDYKQPIKQQLLDSINNANFIQKQSAIDYINSTSNDLSFSEIIKGENVFIIVKSKELFKLTNDIDILLGIKFSFENLLYFPTKVVINNSENLQITLEEFKNQNKSLTIDDLGLELQNSPSSMYVVGKLDDSKVSIELVDGNNFSGWSQFKIIFSEFYSLNGYVENFDYYLNYQFKPLSTSIDYLKDSIPAPTEITDHFVDSFTFNAYLRDANNLSEINDYINLNKNLILKDSSNSFFDIQLIGSSLNVDDFNNIDLMFSINGKINEKIVVTGFSPITISKTQISISSNAANLSFDEIKNNNFIASDLLSISSNIKTPLNEEISIVSKSIETTNNNNVVFVNFVINGVFLEDNNISSYEQNYEVKVKVERAGTDLLFSLTSYDNQSAQTNNSLNWIILVSTLISFTIIILILFLVLGGYKRHNLKKIKSSKLN